MLTQILNFHLDLDLDRYLQAIQCRTWVPIKFNGELFSAQLPPETNSSGPMFREVQQVLTWKCDLPFSFGFTESGKLES